MDFEQLLGLLDIESPEEFQYFENFADLVETEEDIPLEAVYPLLQQVDSAVLEEITTEYFEDLLDVVPEDSTDLYILLDNIKNSLMGMARSTLEESTGHFAEELLRFAQWYTQESQVPCHNLDTGEETLLPLCQALVLARLEKIDGERYGYDFTSCLGYELDEYILDFAAQIREGEEDYAEDEDYLGEL